MQVIYKEFPESFKTVECIKDGDVLYINLSFRASSSTTTIEPLSRRD